MTYVHIEAEVSMVDVASLICFTKLCTNILILTKPRANAQRVVKSVVIPSRVCEGLGSRDFQKNAVGPQNFGLVALSEFLFGE